MEAKQIDWSKATLQDEVIASKIAKRANKELCSSELIGIGIDEFSLQMDIIATHIKCKLKLQELLESAKGDFLHDICGIMQHLNRTTGELQDCFLPRYSAS